MDNNGVQKQTRKIISLTNPRKTRTKSMKSFCGMTDALVESSKTGKSKFLCIESPSKILSLP